MSIVNNLLRLHRWQLEERRRYLAELESLAGRLRADAVRLTADTDFEPHVADSLEQSHSGGRAFTRSLIERRSRLEHSIAEIETQIIEARAAVAAVESEVAHYEAAAAPRSSMGAAGRIHRRVQDGVPYRLRRHGA